MGDMQWLFSQVKGPANDILTEADIISSVRFNHDGSLLATGDKGGRVVVFKKDIQEKSKSSKASKSSDVKPSQYGVCCSFQSHEAEFDYLKSVDIEERVNSIRWLPKLNAAEFLLSTNDKTIKLWKMSEKTQKLGKNSDKNLHKPSTIDQNHTSANHTTTNHTTTNHTTSNHTTSNHTTPTDLSILPLECTPPHVEASVRRVYSNAHTYHINSLAINSDQDNFLSADDLRINLWHYEDCHKCFNIVDIKPDNMEDLSELITSADFHPSDCSTLVYSTSKGSIRLCDMRSRALCDNHSKKFEETEDPSNKSFFSEIISSISQLSFSPSGSLILSRDYFSIKIWDVRMESAPVETYPVHDHLRSRLCSLYEDQNVFDKFEATWGVDDRHILTGSYNSFVRMFDRETKKDAMFECSSALKPMQPLKAKRVVTAGRRVKKDEVGVDNLDLNSKILHADWHPSEALVAVACSANLFFIAAKGS